jgi:hypothetical protein
MTATEMQLITATPFQLETKQFSSTSTAFAAGLTSELIINPWAEEDLQMASLLGHGLCYFQPNQCIQL